MSAILIAIIVLAVVLGLGALFVRLASDPETVRQYQQENSVKSDRCRREWWRGKRG